MTIAIRQTPPTPEQRLAQKIRARTNDTRDILDLLHEIAQGEHDATEHDRLTATGILFDRGYGKTPRQAPAITDPAPSTDPEPDPESAESDNHANHSSDTPSDGGEPALSAAERSRRVTQLDDSLREAIGPAPTTHSPLETKNYPPETNHSPQSTNHSLLETIRDHVMDITNDGDTLIDVLIEVAWPEDPNREVRPFHRNRAARMLLERAAGRDLTPVVTAVRSLPEPILSDEDYPDYPPGYVLDPTKSCIYCSKSLNMPEGHEGEHRRDHEGLAKVRAMIQRMKDELGIKPDPNAPKRNWPISRPSKEWVANNIEVIREEAAKFKEELDLRIERRKAWPAIEERRRKKLAQMYPSHSEDEPAADGDNPDPPYT